MFRTPAASLSRVFFTEAGDLYAYDTEAAMRELVAEGVQGLIQGVSDEDGSYVYFAAGEALFRPLGRRPLVPGADRYRLQSRCAGLGRTRLHLGNDDCAYVP